MNFIFKPFKTVNIILISVLILLIFLLGWTANNLVSSMISVNSEQPFSLSFISLTSPKGLEKQSPSDNIREDQIHVYKDRVVLDIEDATWGSFTDTNSMDPFLDKGSNSIEIQPKQPAQVNIGDIISYKNNAGEILIHRIVKTGVDEKGLYYIVKGDNNPVEDPEKIRFDQIHGVLVGIIY